jgi:hypothetical protein
MGKLRPRALRRALPPTGPTALRAMKENDFTAKLPRVTSPLSFMPSRTTLPDETRRFPAARQAVSPRLNFERDSRLDYSSMPDKRFVPRLIHHMPRAPRGAILSLLLVTIHRLFDAIVRLYFAPGPIIAAARCLIVGPPPTSRQRNTPR